MGYVAVEGGKKAILQSNKLLEYERVKSLNNLELEIIKTNLKELVFQVMSESSLYDEDLAALAIKQSLGSAEEAVFLLRAHRSTLPRLYYTTITDTNDMQINRRISASFKDVPGGQYLGKAYDFSNRFLNFDLINENQDDLNRKKFELEEEIDSNSTDHISSLKEVVDYIEEIGLYNKKPLDNNTPDDITKRSITFPASRSERLQSLTRGQTGAVISIGYAEIRGFGISSHPNIGELRNGYMPLHVKIDDSLDDEYYIGSIELTEVISFCPTEIKGEKSELKFEIGYGLVFGQLETKAIAMSVLDYSLEYASDRNAPTADEEFVLLHIDSVESTGFISHLKLPHYVTFQSELDGMRKINKEGEDE